MPASRWMAAAFTVASRKVSAVAIAVFAWRAACSARTRAARSTRSERSIRLISETAGSPTSGATLAERRLARLREISLGLVAAAYRSPALW